MQSDVDTIEIPIAPAPGRTKIATLPVDGPVTMGMRGAVAEHYKVSMSDFEPHATSLDYLVAAVGACLTGTLSGMLNHLGQPAGDGELSAAARATLVADGGVLRITEIRMRYVVRLAVDVDPRRVVRAHERHQASCPVARSIAGSIAITTSLDLQEP